MIRLESVNKYFNKGKRNEIHVINDTTLELGSKGLVALLGPSGSGKTTLLNAIGGLDKVNGGQIFVDGERITGRRSGKVDEIRNVNIGYVFQDYKLVDSMTVYENVAIALRMIGIKDEREIKKRIDYVLETLNIYRYRNRKADMLSGGERQRVGIARAIAKNPQIIIADEPTGNLDSANTIEIMNIIKAISRERLVVLVTHEVELAKFYASRIIELKDGRVTGDYANETAENLDYRLDNRIYLRDFPRHEKLKGQGIGVDFYGGEADEVNVKIVVRNGNLYIQSAEGLRVEAVDASSAVELVDDHYRELDKSLYEEYDFELDKVADASIKEKYSSVIGFFPALGRGFKKIASYPLIKKILFAGFVLAGAFVTYAMSSIYASLDVHDEDFIKRNRDYLLVNAPETAVEKYLEYEELPQVRYLLPTQNTVHFDVAFDFYYQTQNAGSRLEGSLSDAGELTEGELICGRLPENAQEIVVDKLCLTRLMQEDDTPRQVGIAAPEQFVGLEASAGAYMKPFTIVGITAANQPCVYADRSVFADVIYNQGEGGDYDYDMAFSSGTAARTPAAEQGTLLNYRSVNFEYTLKKGKLPENDYEMIVPYELRGEMPLGKAVKSVKVNGQQLKVCGYYESPTGSGAYLVNDTMIKYILIEKSDGFTVAPTDKEAAFGALRDLNLNAKDAYETDKKAYVSEMRRTTVNSIVMGLIMLFISLIEILLMIRSSFLSRIKEIGIYRAIGVKKSDVYKMFLGEIFAITTVSSMAGVAVTSYVLYHLCKINYVARMFAINPAVCLGAVIVLYVFNALVGMMPVFGTMRKTPAAILSRRDVD